MRLFNIHLIYQFSVDYTVTKVLPVQYLGSSHTAINLPIFAFSFLTKMRNNETALPVYRKCNILYLI